MNKLTGEQCNAKIRKLQSDMCLAQNSDERDDIRGQIARLAQQAAFANRNVFKVNKDEKE